MCYHSGNAETLHCLNRKVLVVLIWTRNLGFFFGFPSKHDHIFPLSDGGAFPLIQGRKLTRDRKITRRRRRCFPPMRFLSLQAVNKWYH